MARNIELIQRVYDMIFEYPGSHHQADWASVNLKTDAILSRDLIPFEEDKHICNTVACVAGWACLLANPDLDSVRINLIQEGQLYYSVGPNFEPRARYLMGISEDFAETLFESGQTRTQILWLLDALIKGKNERAILKDYRKIFNPDIWRSA